MINKILKNKYVYLTLIPIILFLAFSIWYIILTLLIAGILSISFFKLLDKFNIHIDFYNLFLSFVISIIIFFIILWW